MHGRYRIKRRTDGTYAVVDEQTHRDVYVTASYADAVRQARGDGAGSTQGFGDDGTPMFMLTEVAPYIASTD